MFVYDSLPISKSKDKQEHGKLVDYAVKIIPPNLGLFQLLKIHWITLVIDCAESCY